MKFALRQLAQSPGFTAVAVLSLALGIGANTAVFSVMNAVLLARLPVPAPEELVIFNWLAEENVGPKSSSGWRTREPGSKKNTSTSFSFPTFEAFRKNPGPLAEVFAFAPAGGLNLNVDGVAEIVAGAQYATGTYHRGLGVQAAAGRLLGPADDDPAGEAVAVLSHRFWLRRFGGDPAAIGKKVSVNGVPVTIVGVTAAGFSGTQQVGEVTDLTLPLVHEPRLSRAPWDSRSADNWWVRIMGRLQPGATLPQAAASLQGVFQETARGALSVSTLPGAPAVDPAKIPLPELRAVPGGQGLYEARRNYEKSLRLLLGVVGLVLLVACANVANLLLARGAARRREIAVRLALGASRARLVRQLLAESVLLAGLGAAGGLAVAVWGSRALLAMQPFGNANVHLELALDWRVLGFASAAALATGLVFGLAPALRATKLNLTEEFQGGARTLGGGARSTLARSLLVVQVALSLVLLVGAGLFVRTLRNLQAVDVGFNREQLLLFQLNAAATGANGAQSFAFYQRLRDRFAALPGVRSATFSRIAPLSQSNWTIGVTVPGYTPTAMFESVQMNGLGADYLATLELPLLRGRDFTARDQDPAAPKVAIVNQAFAKKYFGTEDVLGRRFRLGRSAGSTECEIIGLVRDAHYSDVKSTPRPTAFQPYAQLGSNSAGVGHFVVRFTGSEAAITAALRAAARDIDAAVPITNLRTQEQQIDRLFAQERLFASLCSVFGGLALLLCAVGLYGLMSYSVVRRTGEIGLRMALGALPRTVLAMVVRESLGLVVLGVLLGLGAAWGATHLVASLLFGLTRTDPVSYAVGALALLVVGTLACLLPARRAARIAPMQALRTE